MGYGSGSRPNFRIADDSSRTLPDDLCYAVSDSWVPIFVYALTRIEILGLDERRIDWNRHGEDIRQEMADC